MNDLISRADAIEEIARRDTTDGTVKVFSGREVNDILHNIPSAPRWIPCSERLPEENVPVNITWANRNPVSYYANIKDVPFVATGVYFDGKWYWWSSIVEDLLAEYGRAQWDKIVELMDEAIEVIAWMPLPEPYRKDEEKGEAE